MPQRTNYFAFLQTICKKAFAYYKQVCMYVLKYPAARSFLNTSTAHTHKQTRIWAECNDLLCVYFIILYYIHREGVQTYKFFRKTIEQIWKNKDGRTNSFFWHIEMLPFILHFVLYLPNPFPEDCKACVWVTWINNSPSTGIALKAKKSYAVLLSLSRPWNATITHSLQSFAYKTSII